MEETSRSHVTVTFGRSSSSSSSQVANRAGLVSNADIPSFHHAPGNKRSVRDRLGSGGGDSGQLVSKRQRAVNDRSSQNSNGLNDVHLDKNDLRFKLMEMNVLRQFQSDVGRNGMDLREKLSRAARDSLTSPSFHERMPERRDTRYTVPDTSQSSLTNPSFRERKPEGRESRYLVQDTRNYNVLGGDPSVRRSDSFNRVDTLRNTNSPWTLESLRKRSPVRDIGETKRPPARAFEEDPRKAPYTSKDFHALDPGRRMGSPPYITMPVVAMTKEISASARPSLQIGIVPKTSCMGNEHSSVENLLKSLGLEKYGIIFKAEEIDIATLKQMGDNDLKDLGIPMGPRKKLMLALLPHTSRVL